MSEAVERRNPLLAGVAATAIAIEFVVAIIAFWTRFAIPSSDSSVPVVGYFLGAIFLVQLVRSVFIDDWLRRGATFGTVVGVLVMLVGLNPMASCADTFPLQCSTSFRPVFPILAVGFLLTVGTVYVDIRRR